MASLSYMAAASGGGKSKAASSYRTPPKVSPHRVAPQPPGSAPSMLKSARETAAASSSSSAPDLPPNLASLQERIARVKAGDMSEEEKEAFLASALEFFPGRIGASHGLPRARAKTKQSLVGIL